MRIFFIGNVLFSREMLTEILTVDNIEIVGLATKSKAQFNSDHSDISDLAIENNIPFKYVKDINAPHILEWISSLRADVILCLGWSSLIKKDLLTLTKFGVVGYHPAELPFNRGRHPIIWALVLGLKRTASTFFIMDEGADSGDIISQVLIDIEHDDNSQKLYEKLIQSSKKQIKDILTDMKNNSLKLKPQNKSLGNLWRKRGAPDGRIDWRMKGSSIYNLVRALDKPYPGAHFDFLGKEIKVWKCSYSIFEENGNLEPGKVLNVVDNKIEVKTADGSVTLINHEFDLTNIPEYLL